MEIELPRRNTGIKVGLRRNVNSLGPVVRTGVKWGVY